MFGVARKHAAEDKIDLFSVFLQHIRPLFFGEGGVKGVVAALFDVFFVVVEGVDEVHPLADAVGEGAGIFGGKLPQTVVCQVRHHGGEGVCSHIGAGAVCLFQFGKRRHALSDEGACLRVPLFRLAVRPAEEGARRPALVFVFHVVAQLIIGERRVQAGEHGGQLVVGGDRPADEGVQRAAALLDLDVGILYIVQEKGQKCHVIGEGEAGTLPAAAAQALAQSAVHGSIQYAVLDIHMRDIRLDVAEHALTPPPKNRLCGIPWKASCARCGTPVRRPSS